MNICEVKSVEGIYEATALAMRYWFMIVGVIVLLGVTGLSVKEYRDKRFVLNLARSSIGFLSVLSGPDDVMGENVQLMDKNTIGRSRRCDIVLGDRSVNKVHAQITKPLSGRVYLGRLGGGGITLNGSDVGGRARLKSGDVVCFGNVVAEVHLKEED